jgi:hypothetical protein
MSTGNPIASAQFNGDPNLRCDLLDVKRTSGAPFLFDGETIYDRGPIWRTGRRRGS